MEVSDAGEHLSKLRKRVALAQFYDRYAFARANSHELLPTVRSDRHLANAWSMKSKNRGSSHGLPPKRRSRPPNAIHQRIVDLMFPGTILGNENVTTEEGRVKRAKKEKNRNTASKRLTNWKASGKPWSQLIARFGLGILLLLPTDLSNEK